MKTVKGSNVYEVYGNEHYDSVEQVQSHFLLMKVKHFIKTFAKNPKLDHLSPSQIFEKVMEKVPDKDLTRDQKKKQMNIIRRIRYLKRLTRRQREPVAPVKPSSSGPTKRPKRAAAPTDFVRFR